MLGLRRFGNRHGPLLGGTFDGIAVADARREPLHIRIRQYRRKGCGCRIVVGNALAGREPDRAPHRIEMLDTVALQPREIEPFEDAQRQQELESLAWRRQRVDARPRYVAVSGSFHSGLTAARSSSVSDPPSLCRCATIVLPSAPP